MNKIVFSLILTSIDRTNDVRNFFLSLRRQADCNFAIEIIFIDQSNGLFTDILNEFNDLNIISIKYKKCSLSAARNLGLTFARGYIFAFPDDDCTYYPNTLSSVYDYLSNKSKQAVVGRIFDNENDKPLLKKWPKNGCVLDEHSVFKYASSITIFSKLKIKFDDRMGAGANFGSCEDVDFLYNLIKLTSVSYVPDIKVWHPDYSLESVTLAKAFAYGKGFGFFHRKNLSYFWLYHFILGCAYSFFRMIESLLLMNFHGVRIRFYSILGRIFGFFNIKSDP